MATVGTGATGGGIFARVHWGAVVAGALLAIGVHIVMGLIGAAMGLAAQPADSRALGAGAAIWALLTPFVATVCGAWFAIRLSGEVNDRASIYVHGILVWCIGLIAGALFLTGTGATGAMTAGAAASGNLGAAQRMVRGNVGPTAARSEADQAGRVGAAASGGAALAAIAAIAGLLGAVVATGLAGRRGIGRGRGLRWRIAIQRRDEREAYAGDGGRSRETGYRPTAPGTYGGTRPGGLGREEGPPDPYQH
jgi:hypothetical protein